MWNNGWFLWIVLILMTVVATGFSEKRKLEDSRVYRFISERTVSGTVDKISNNRISVRTDDGKIQVFIIGPSRLPRFAVKNIAQGDRIVLSFNRNNYQVLEVVKTNEYGFANHPGFLSNPPVNQIKFIQTKAE